MGSVPECSSSQPFLLPSPWQACQNRWNPFSLAYPSQSLLSSQLLSADRRCKRTQCHLSFLREWYKTWQNCAPTPLFTPACECEPFLGGRHGQQISKKRPLPRTWRQRDTKPWTQKSSDDKKTEEHETKVKDTERSSHLRCPGNDTLNGDQDQGEQ